MLVTLRIQNFMLVSELELKFEQGLSTLTGETGAGKSMLVDALQGLLGARLSMDQIRQGAEFAYLEAGFSLSEPVRAFLRQAGFEELCTEPLLLISRSLQRTGSKSRLNGQLVSLQLIRELAPLLLDSAGQHENQVLFREEAHLSLLDELGDAEHQALRTRMQAAWQQLQQLTRARDERQQQLRELQRQEDFLRFQAEEIQAAELQAGEDELLQQERERLRHSEKLRYTVQAVSYELCEQDEPPALLGRLSALRRQLEQLTRYDEHLNPLSTQMGAALIQLEDLGAELSTYLENLDSDPLRLEHIETRLGLIRRLQHKYGGSVAEILACGEQIQQQLNQLEGGQEQLTDICTACEQVQQECHVLATALSASRAALASQLAPLLEHELRELGMEHSRFQAELQPQPLASHGQDRVRFLLSPNPGEPLRPLARIASGGEMSRILLALKLVLKRQQPVSTLIFDEIDTGISGKAALAVSQKLARLAQTTQILCITHLPVIAAAADQQLWIEKQTHTAQTQVQVSLLSPSERIARLAQMGNGQVTDTTLENAREMVAHARWYTQVLARAS